MWILFVCMNLGDLAYICLSESQYMSTADRFLQFFSIFAIKKRIFKEYRKGIDKCNTLCYNEENVPTVQGGYAVMVPIVKQRYRHDTGSTIII